MNLLLPPSSLLPPPASLQPVRSALCSVSSPAAWTAARPPSLLRGQGFWSLLTAPGPPPPLLAKTGGVCSRPRAKWEEEGVRSLRAAPPFIGPATSRFPEGEAGSGLRLSGRGQRGWACQRSACPSGVLARQAHRAPEADFLLSRGTHVSPAVGTPFCLRRSRLKAHGGVTHFPIPSSDSVTSKKGGLP